LKTADVAERALAVMRSSICWDNHACMPLRPGDDRFLPQLERVRKAGFDVVSLNVSFDVVGPSGAFPVLASFRHWLRNHPEQYRLIDTVADIEVAKANGQLAVCFDIEGGNAVAAHPGLVELFYRSGVRWMLFAYNKNNKLGGGCMDEDSGLTDYGRKIIDEMERVGMVLCCSHVGHRTALEAIEYSRLPMIFSHSNPSRVHPHARNISDELMIACAKTGGVVNINGVGKFLGDGSDGLGDSSTETILRHIDYAAQLIGPAHVGLGLDYVFDVAEMEELVRQNPGKFPSLFSAAGSYQQVEPERLPQIVEGLLRMGYSDSDVQAIIGHNNLRVARAVWK
jgi:membrane dipeptidase